MNDRGRRIEVVPLLADAVAVSYGKLDTQGGGWNQIYTARLPSFYPRIGLALLLSVPRELVEIQHDLEVRLEGPNGSRQLLGFLGDDPTQPVDALEASFHVDRPPPESEVDYLSLPLALNFERLMLEEPGEYRFTVRVNGDEAAVAPFHVAVSPALAPAAQTS